MNFLRKFFYGRYGSDALSVLLLVLSVILVLIGQLARVPVVVYLSYLPLLLCLLRMLSKNHAARRKENELFFRVIAPFRKVFYRTKEAGAYKFLSCPSCKQSLRVPRGKGKLTVTCPKCRARFDAKS